LGGATRAKEAAWVIGSSRVIITATRYTRKQEQAAAGPKSEESLIATTDKLKPVVDPVETGE
jgi:hypothetical protein